MKSKKTQKEGPSWCDCFSGKEKESKRQKKSLIAKTEKEACDCDCFGKSSSQITVVHYEKDQSFQQVRKSKKISDTRSTSSKKSPQKLNLSGSKKLLDDGKVGLELQTNRSGQYTVMDQEFGKKSRIFHISQAEQFTFGKEAEEQTPTGNQPRMSLQQKKQLQSVRQMEGKRQLKISQIKSEFMSKDQVNEQDQDQQKPKSALQRLKKVAVNQVDIRLKAGVVCAKKIDLQLA